MMPIPLAPEADKVLDLLAGLVTSPEGFHSLVALRMEGHWSTLVTSTSSA
jgi:hypothetical protein